MVTPRRLRETPAACEKEKNGHLLAYTVAQLVLGYTVVQTSVQTVCGAEYLAVH